MSGIVGILNLDGEPVDRSLLQRMTEHFSNVSDEQNIWSHGKVGFGHALLRTTWESEQEQQPMSLDEQVWITADARIDDRARLITKLKGKNCQVTESVPDVQLILSAYQVWGEDCLQHLIGDFAFAIWDERQQRLFCARDHYGVKPFYYACLGRRFLFSSSINCLRQHPLVSNDLNELAIADFLLFGSNQEPTTTTFADIQCLPAAHALICSRVAPVHISKYWQLPIRDCLRYRNPQDYIDHFLEIWLQAVSDRLRTNNVGVKMSGGLDSTAIAATAHRLLSQQTSDFDLQAHTIVYDHLLSDQERYYSGLAAQALGIPVYYLVADHYQLYERWQDLHPPEPCNNALDACSADFVNQIAACHRVVLNGLGGDVVLFPTRAFNYIHYLFQNKQLHHLASDLWHHITAHRRLPPPGIRAPLKKWLKLDHSTLRPLPRWLNSSLVSRLDLQTRWEALRTSEPDFIHPSRPEAYESLQALCWSDIMSSSHHSLSQVYLEERYPFFDVRIVEYLFTLPVWPWFTDKHLLRKAMTGFLPEAIRLRPKTPLGGDPVSLQLEQSSLIWQNSYNTQEIATYVNLVEFNQVVQEKYKTTFCAWLDLQPIGLAHWFKQFSMPSK